MNATASNNGIVMCKVIHVNAIEMDNVIGKDESTICLIDYWELKRGQQVKIQVRTVTSHELTGLYCFRYVKSIKPLIPLYMHENYIEVTLTAFKPE